MTLALPRQPPWPFVRACLFGLAAMVATALPSHIAPTPFNNYVLLANAFLHHHAWIEWPGRYIDAVEWNGRRYVVNDPVPAILLLPYVAYAGLEANQTLLSVILAGFAAAAAWGIAENLDVPLRRAAVVCAFLFAGTDLWWGSVLGDVWFLAQTSAVAFMLLSLLELSAPKPRGWVVAFFYALALGSRFTVVTALPVIAYFVYLGNLDAYRPVYENRLRRLLGFGLVMAIFAALWMFYNDIRWGVVWDSGHTIFFHQDVSAGSPFGSPFGLQHIGYQLNSFLILRPQIFVYDHRLWIIPRKFGTALTWTSPALIFALWAREPYLSVRALWIATFLAAAPSLLYYVNGYSQFGMRHALDFEPFLFVLMLFAARRNLPAWISLLVLYSIAATAYGIWFWLHFYPRPVLPPA
jgi:hypothetical protein